MGITRCRRLRLPGSRDSPLLNLVPALCDDVQEARNFAILQFILRRADARAGHVTHGAARVDRHVAHVVDVMCDLDRKSVV